MKNYDPIKNLLKCLNSKDPIPNLIADFSSLLSSELTLEEIFSHGDQKIKVLRILYQQNKFSDEIVEIINDFKSTIEIISIILDVKQNMILIRSKEETEDYILYIDSLCSSGAFSDLNVKRLATIKRSLLEKYKVYAKNITNNNDESHKYDKDYDQELFDKLRKLRKTISVEENVPAFFIAWDQTLIELATIKPISHSGLMFSVRIGKAFIKKYGNKFIEVIKNHIAQKN